MNNVIETEITETLIERLSVAHLSLVNESYMHNVPEGSESHFKLVLVSDDFEGKRLVQRHQAVYKALADVMPKFHALAMHLYTIEEWRVVSDVPLSPKCHGGE